VEFCGSISRVEDGRRYLAVMRRGPRVVAGEAIAYQIVGYDFVYSLTLKDMITKWVVALATWAEGFISSVE
jgi:hypothetical protein